MATTQTLPDAAIDFYRRGQQLSALGVLEMRRLWRRMTLDDIDVAWSGIRTETVTSLAALQVAAAREAVDYVPEVLREQGMDAPAVATVEPLAFARGSSGLALTDVVDTVPAAVKRAIGQSARDVALQRGLTLLEGITETQIADAARLAAKADMVTRPDVQTWTRVLNLPSCGRCAILGGVVYKWREPMKRHPRCDCRFVVSTERDAPPERLINPREYFDSLAPADQNKYFGKREAAAIRDGKDVAKAVNASRDRWRVRLANERRAARDAETLADTDAATPQTFMESLINRVENRDQAIRNLANAGFIAA